MHVMMPDAGDMVMLGVSVSGPAAADVVWERYARPDLWKTWSPQIRRVEVASQRLSGGETGRVHGPLGVSVDFTVDLWDEDARMWSWTVRPHGSLLSGVRRAQMSLLHTVQPEGAGSSTSLVATGIAPLVAAYLPVARLALHRLVH
jgi:hypothetical protein